MNEKGSMYIHTLPSEASSLCPKVEEYNTTEMKSRLQFQCYR